MCITKRGTYIEERSKGNIDGSALRTTSNAKVWNEIIMVRAEIENEVIHRGTEVLQSNSPFLVSGISYRRGGFLNKNQPFSIKEAFRGVRITYIV